MPDTEKKNKKILLSISSAIINYRYVVFLLFIVFGIYCGINLGRGGSNADLTAFLSPETETRQGLAAMDSEFIEYATADIMVSNITFDQAKSLARCV